MEWVLFPVIILLVLIIFYTARSYFRLRARLSEALSSKQSLSTKYGRMTEQFIPLLDLYPYDENRFRFLGNPIDGVQFNDDGIVFVEFKAAGSRLSPDQKRIKELVEQKRVRFHEIRIPAPANPP
ncbi:MAG: endonuclease [Candidatus Aenigmarchaeota archaeon]|nr:endonuclease [Candidatus Aenigmarchaeota archaeon]